VVVGGLFTRARPFDVFRPRIRTVDNLQVQVGGHRGYHREKRISLGETSDGIETDWWVVAAMQQFVWNLVFRHNRRLIPTIALPDRPSIRE
jgi:hypothetical protein